MSANPNDEPFEMKSQEPQDIGDNTPVIVPNESPAPESYPVVGESAKPKTDHVLWYIIGGIVLAACCVVSLLVYTFIRSNPFRSTFVLPTPLPTLSPGDLTATQRAWIKPAESPTLGSAKDAKLAIDNDTTYLETYAFRQPYSFPEIDQPGDVYIYEISINRSQKALWDYGWCTTTQEILDQNFEQMKVEFFLNQSRVSTDHLTWTDYQRSDGGFCRSLTALVTRWPVGLHILESRITFLKPTDDGWNLYPAGTHTFKYFVHVE